MKKILLSILFLFTAFVGYGQTGNVGANFANYLSTEKPNLISEVQFFSYQAYNYQGMVNDEAVHGTIYDNDNCSTILPLADIGGFDPDVFGSEGGSGFPGITFFGGGIRTVFYPVGDGAGANACVRHDASFGFNFIDINTDPVSKKTINLSSPADQKISFTITNNVANAGSMLTTVYFQLQDVYFNRMLRAVPVVLQAGTKDYFIDFSGDILEGASLAGIYQASLVYSSTVKSDGFGVAISNVRLGDGATSVAKGNSINDLFSVYPNPTSDVVNLKFDESLTGIGSPEITVFDTMGNVVTKTSNTSFSLTGVEKGVYTVQVNANGNVGHKKLVIN
jgi:hypothetical protein